MTPKTPTPPAKGRKQPAMPVPAPSPKDGERISFTLPDELHDALEQEAASEGLALASHIRRILTLRHNTLKAAPTET